MLDWIIYGDGDTIGSVGSENGVILRDEEYDGECRITLEKCSRYYAITCGIYGEMVHTAFCDPEEGNAVFDAMKDDLANFLSEEHTDDQACDFYDDFCHKY